MTKPSRAPRVASARWLHMATGLCVIIAVVLWTWPIDPTQPARDGASTSKAIEPVWSATLSSDATTREDAEALMARSQRVIASNVFSASRKAPTSRFVVPGQAPMSEPAATSNDAPDTMDPDVEQFPRLSGIVVMDGERRALLQMTADDGAPRLYRAGEQHAGVRVLRIDPTHVVLTSRSGARTLRLSDRASRDSAEKSP